MNGGDGGGGYRASVRSRVSLFVRRMLAMFLAARPRTMTALTADATFRRNFDLHFQLFLTSRTVFRRGRVRRFSDPLFNDRSDTCCWEYFTLIDVDGSDDKCLCFRCWSLSTSSCLRFCSKSAACFSRYFSRVSFWGARVAKACPCLLACAPWSVRNASALWEIGAGKLKAELCRFDRPLSDIDSPSNGKVVDASEYTPPPMSHMLSINELSWLRVVWKVSSKDWLSSFGFLAAWLA